MNLTLWLIRHINWSARTFGHGKRTEGLIKHITTEFDEIRAHPTDLMEWIDIVILALDGAWRAGYSADQISAALVEKQRINEQRRWPPPMPEDQPTEHIRDV